MTLATKPTEPAASAGVPGTESGEGGPLLTVKDLRVYFPITGGVLRRRTGWVKAVDGVDFHIDRGETLGLVGESGSGKTTIGRTIVRITEPISGAIQLAGQDLLSLRGEDLRRRRRKFQMVFQDPYSKPGSPPDRGRDPRRTAPGPPSRRRKARTARVTELLELVGLDPAFVERYPHEFSGGQRQRIGSPARSRWNRISSSVMSRSARWTSRSRHRSSTCWSASRTTSD